MSAVYRLMYLLGFTPWDGVLPDELRDLIEGPNALPPGRALDLGCGKGGKSIYMAGHGWQVTGIENVARALADARKRAEAANVAIDFRRGDVTNLSDLSLEPGYALMLDFGCYHGLRPAQRDAYANGVTALASHGATLLMMAFTRAVPPIPAGVSESELMARFGPSWEMAWSHPDRAAGTSAMRRAAAGWFCLTRH
ncbi:MAG: class I SAM-dependent methyltransferase [Candidatus Dormiibacterota bacterium]